MSPPISTESRTFASFLLPTGSSSFASGFDSRVSSSCHPSSTAISFRRHAVSILLLLILGLRQTTSFTEGAFSIERNVKARGGELEPLESQIPWNVRSGRSNSRSYVATKRDEPTEDTSLPSQIHRRGTTDIRAIQRRTPQEADRRTNSRDLGKKIGYITITTNITTMIHEEKNVWPIPTRSINQIFLLGDNSSNFLIPCRRQDCSTTDIENSVVHGKRSVGVEALRLLSPRGGGNSSLGSVTKFDEPAAVVVVAADSDGGSLSELESSQKTSYKPGPLQRIPAPPPVPTATQVDKYDRRHFGPPRLENLEEVSYDGTTTPNLLFSTLDNEEEYATTTSNTIDRHEASDRSFQLIRSSTPSLTMETVTETRVRTIEIGSTIVSGTETTGETAFGTSAAPSHEVVVDKLELTILGLFELTRGTTEPRPEGPSELQSARLAVDRINDMAILPKIRLRLIHNDTRCDPGVAVDRFFHALYTSRNTTIMPLLLGTACSEVTETLAKIVPYWNIVQVSFGSTAPALSDPTEFPLFARTVAPDSSHNPARISLIKHFGWDTVTALSQNGDMYSLAVNDLVTELEQANITCTATITFGENDYKEQLRTLKELDTRIIIGSFSPKLAPRLFCEAWKLGMHGGDYAWILPAETIDLSGMTGDWWHSGPEDCSSSQLSQTLDGLVIVESYGTVLADHPSYSGLTTAEFTSELAKRGVTSSKYAGQTYDAVWSMALALRNLETFLNRENSSIAHYTHSRRDMAHRLLKELKSLNFPGVSGPVSFDGADRVGITAFYQMHGHAVRRIALYTPEDGQLTMNCPGCARTRWPGEHPPVAKRVFRFRMVTIESAAFLAVTCLASIGVTLALAFLAFNLHFRKHKSIKLSSPRLNNMAAVGCALVYGAVILLGLDHATLSDSDGYFPTICTARAYLLSAGFSLAFGSMFTKTYRVHRIFTRSRSGVVKNKLLQDTQLISLICVLLLIDGVVVTLWVTLDPMQRVLRNLTLEISSEDRAVIYQPQVEVCRSQHTNGWLAALYAYKGLLLIVGVYMAWETRHVKIPALNDSQYIGMSVYSVVITSGIVVVLANLMSDRATLAFVTITTLILASTTGTLALLFLPQLANILAGERADPVVQSLGLKIECNTRRFVTDDSRELQYRVEVQNRVYRREMAQLELELARLEKQLGQEPVEPSHASSSASIPQRNPSIVGSGLPLLLLSVLPPVIPRASWPSADPSGMRRGTVAFSSQPDLEPDGPRRSLADIYKLQWRRDTEVPSRLGVFQRLFSLFGSRPNSRKTSTASFTGVASALRVHMGYIAGLVPGTKASSSCQVNVQGVRTPHPRCGSGPIINITSEEDRRLSLGLRRKESSEPRVNFSLPLKSSASQSSSRERIRGSPRFPHRIVPANSLSAIATGSIKSTAHHRWHSMEDASKQKLVTSTQRGSSCSPSCDVWATYETGIPLSELGHCARGRKPPDTLVLTIQADSNVTPDEALLGSDLQKLFRENNITISSPSAETNQDDAGSTQSKTNSPYTPPTTQESTYDQIDALELKPDSEISDMKTRVDEDSKNSELSLTNASKDIWSSEVIQQVEESKLSLDAIASEVPRTDDAYDRESSDSREN